MKPFNKSLCQNSGIGTDIVYKQTHKPTVVGSFQTIFTRQFVALCAVILIGSTSYSAFYVYPTILRSMGMNERDMGLVMGSVYFGTLIGMPLTMKSLRIIGARRIVGFGLASLAATTLLLMAATTLPVICGLRMAQGLGWSAILIACNVLATAAVPSGRMAQGLTIYGAFFISGQSVGPLVATAATGATGSFNIFFITSAAIAVVGLAGVPRLPNLEGLPQGGPQRHQMRWKPTIGPLSSTFLLTIPYSAATAFVADYAHSVGLTAASSGFFGGFLIASLLTRFCCGHLLDISMRALVIFSGAAVAAMGCLCLAFLQSAWQLWVGGGLLGVATSIYYPALQALLVERSADRVPAVTASIFVITVALIVGSAGGGIAAGIAGYPALFALMAVVSALGGGVVLPTLAPVKARQTSSA